MSMSQEVEQVESTQPIDPPEPDEAVEGIPSRDVDRQVELFYEEFGSSSIGFVVRFWIDFRRQAQYLQARSDDIMAIKSAFDAHGITIPFPIRTLDFGIVGGERLAETLVPFTPERRATGSTGPEAS